MTVAVEPATRSGADRLLVAAGSLAIAGAVAAALARRAGLVAPGWTIAVILAAGSIALGVLVRFVGRRATVDERARVAARIAAVGLGLSALSVAGALPVLTRAGGWSTFAADVGGHALGLLALFVLAACGRTMGWRVLLGMGFLGFLALPALARTVGEPVLQRLGASAPLGHSLWIPATENLLELLPVLVVALLAARRPQRPAALDMMLLGTCVGIGFALSENAAYGRGGPHWSVAPPLSWLFPSVHGGPALGTWWFGGGHLIAGAAMGIGVGISVLYRRRYRWAVLAAPVLYVVTVAEHAMNNLLASRNDAPFVTVLQVVTLGGTLSAFLLLGAAGWLAQVERTEPLRAALRHGLFLRPTVAKARMHELGVRQRAVGAPEGQR